MRWDTSQDEQLAEGARVQVVWRALSASPDSLNTLLAHRPTGVTQQRRDPAISVAAILAGKLDDVGSQRDLIIRCRGESSDASIGAGPMPGMLVSPRCQAR